MSTNEITVARAAATKAGQAYASGAGTYEAFVAAEARVESLAASAAAREAEARSEARAVADKERGERDARVAEEERAASAAAQAPWRRRLDEIRSSLPRREPFALMLVTENTRNLAAAFLTIAQARRAGLQRWEEWHARRREIAEIQARLGEPIDGQEDVPVPSQHLEHEVSVVERVVSEVSRPGATWAGLLEIPHLASRRDLLEIVVAVAESGGPDLRPRRPTEEERAELEALERSLATATETVASSRLVPTGPAANPAEIVERDEARQKHDAAMAAERAARAKHASVKANLAAKNVDLSRE